MASRNQSRRRSLSPHVMATGRQMADRLLYGLVKAIGRKAIVSLNSGLKISGILYTIGDFSGDGNFSICLKFPLDETVATSNDRQVEIFDSEYLLIPNKDILMMKMQNVDFTTVEKNGSEDNVSEAFNAVSSGEANGFKTDSAISSEHHTFQPHALKKWVPDDGLLEDSLDALESNIGRSNGGHWDQFKANEEKFNIHSTFDESLYTTTISKDSPDFRKRLKEADRIAHEIESQGTHGNVHLAEERGLHIDDSGLDEEDKYSGVMRDQSSVSSKEKSQQSGKQNEDHRHSAHPDQDKILMGMLKSNQQKSTSSSVRPVQAGKYATPRQRAAYYHKDPAVIYSSAVSNLPAKPGKKLVVEESVVSSKKVHTIKGSPPTSAPDSSSTSKVPERPKAKTAGILDKNKAVSSSARTETASKHQSDIAALKEFSAHLKISENVPDDILPLISKARLQRQRTDAEGSGIKANARPQHVVTDKEVITEASKSLPTKKLLSDVSKNDHNSRISQKEYSASPEPSTTKAKEITSMTNKVSSNSVHASTRNNTDTRYNQSQQGRHRRSPVSFFGVGRVPSDALKAKKNLLEGRFNILVSAKVEYKQKLKSEEKSTPAETILIIQIERPFTTTPTWPSTESKSYKSAFSLQPEWVPAPSMGRKMFIPSQTIPMLAPQSMPPPIMLPSGGPPRMMEMGPLTSQQSSQQFGYGRRGSSASRRNNSQSSSPNMPNISSRSPIQGVQPGLPHISQQPQQQHKQQQGQQPVQPQQMPIGSGPPQPIHMQSPTQMGGMQMGAVPQYQFMYQQPQFIPMYTPNPMAMNGAQPMSFYPGIPPPMMPGNGGMMPRRNSRNRGGHYARQ